MKILFTILTIFLFTTFSEARETHRQYTVTVEKNVDGDTIRVKGPAYWPSFTRSILIRINGVDTPEKGGRAACEREKNFASVASTLVAENYPVGSLVKIKLKFKNGKYVHDKFWRLLGDVKSLKPKGEWLSEFLISRDLAYEYHGGKKRNPWC